MTDLEKLVKFEEELNINPVYPVRQLYGNWENFIIKNGIPPNYPLVEILSILLYMSQANGNFYSKLCNMDMEPRFNEMKSYFCNSLNLQLEKLPSYGERTFHHIQNELGIDFEKMSEEFQKLGVGTRFVCRKFLSSSKIWWENSKIVFEILPLKSDSGGKDVSNVFYDNQGNEEEVLFKLGSCFEIKSIEVVNNSACYAKISLQELTVSASEVCHEYEMQTLRRF